MSGVSEAAVAATKKVPHVFVSYSHADKAALDGLRVQLHGLRNAGVLIFWDDRGLVVGDPFDEEIRRELAQADIVIALVSSTWLASPYVYDTEMAPFRGGAAAARLFPVLIEDCAWEPHAWLSRLKTAQADAKQGETPILDLDAAGQKKAWATVARELYRVIERVQSESSSQPAADAVVPPPMTGSASTEHSTANAPSSNSPPLDIAELQRFWRVRLIARSLPSDVTFDKLSGAAAAAGAGLAGEPRADALLRSDAEQLAALLEREHADGRLEMAKAELEPVTAALRTTMHPTSARAWARAAATPFPPESAKEFIPVRGRESLLKDAVQDEEARVRWLFVVFPYDWKVSKFGSQLETHAKSALTNAFVKHLDATLPDVVTGSSLSTCAVAAYNRSANGRLGAAAFGEVIDRLLGISPVGSRAVALLHWQCRAGGNEPAMWLVRSRALCEWAGGHPDKPGAVALHLVTISAPRDRQAEVVTALDPLVAQFSKDAVGARCIVHEVEPHLDRNAVSDFLREHRLCAKEQRDDVTKAIQALATGYADTLALLEDAWALHSDGQGGPIDWDDVLSIWATYRERKAGPA